MVMARPGTPVLSAEQLQAQLGPGLSRPIRLLVAETPSLDLSSRDLRRRVAAGRTIRYFLPRAVEVYIQEKRLYQPGGQEAG